tara:strand:+ start:339 stop:587 length:249 start_codon:yes stop_codon:yes gene_type:complete
MIGKTVWRTFGHSSLRFGTVIEEKMSDGWKFVRVDWVDDHEFQMDRQRLIDLRGVDCRSDWDRIDKVSVFNKEEMFNKINKL